MPSDNLFDEIYDDELIECYPQRIKTLAKNDIDTSLIEKGISEVEDVLNQNERSFVVYGEPQSGKTEFMIALTCKLIDMGKQTIFIVMNDNTELENQNFVRFQKAAELNPAPLRDRELTYMQDGELKVAKQRIIFCRKNSKNLQKLRDKCRFMRDRVVIDDEADFATPNAKINKDEATAINKYLGELGKLTDEFNDDRGIYIGVTATPGRLDLNNTYLNNSNRWVFLQSHKNYKGRTFFFPSTDAQRAASDYVLIKLPDDKDEPKFLRHAVFRYLIRVAILNELSAYDFKAFSMLVHTGGKTNDHLKDQHDIQQIFSVIENRDHPKHHQYLAEILKIAEELVEYYEADFSGIEITKFIYWNVGRRQILVINHKQDGDNVQRAGKPEVLFTFAIGGNIVSRGLTFENLLTFYFSRNVKGKLQQNTYIQRARMFGNRPYSKYFELCVPESLYRDWADCFQDHELSLILARSGAYQHLESKRTSAADSAAIDKQHVFAIRTERPIGEKFALTSDVEKRLLDGKHQPLTTLRELLLLKLLDEAHMPTLLMEYMQQTSKADESDVLLVVLGDKRGEYQIQDIERYYKTGGDSETITRQSGGGMIEGVIKRVDRNIHKHYLMPIRNIYGEARFYYKPNLGHSILQNIRTQKPVNRV